MAVDSDVAVDDCVWSDVGTDVSKAEYGYGGAVVATSDAAAADGAGTGTEDGSESPLAVKDGSIMMVVADACTVLGNSYVGSSVYT